MLIFTRNIDFKLFFFLVETSYRFINTVLKHTKSNSTDIQQFFYMCKHFLIKYKMSKLIYPKDKTIINTCKNTHTHTHNNNRIMQIITLMLLHMTEVHTIFMYKIICAVNFYSHMKYLHRGDVIRCPHGSLNT